MKKSLATQAKENPIMASLATLAAIAALGTSLWQGAGLLDTLVVTHAELDVYDEQPHGYASELEQKIDQNALVDKCQFLRIEMRSLDDAIYQRRRDGVNGDALRDLETELEELRETYRALRCAALLA